jgi:hypothetical protein
LNDGRQSPRGGLAAVGVCGRRGRGFPVVPPGIGARPPAIGLPHRQRLLVAPGGHLVPAGRRTRRCRGDGLSRNCPPRRPRGPEGTRGRIPELRGRPRTSGAEAPHGGGSPRPGGCPSRAPERLLEHRVPGRRVRLQRFLEGKDPTPGAGGVARRGPSVPLPSRSENFPARGSCDRVARHAPSCTVRPPNGAPPGVRPVECSSTPRCSGRVPADQPRWRRTP